MQAEFDENMLLDIEGVINRHQEAEVALNQMELNMKSLQAEIALVKEKEGKLQHMIPEHESIERLLATTNKNIALLVEELTRVRSNIAHVPNDIILNERVVGTKAFPMLPVKILALIFIAAVFTSGLYTTAVVTYDIVFGTITPIGTLKDGIG